MVLLVMSRNLLMTYMCWEAMGICSYLLISHWAERPAAGAAATKAFLVNAVADVGFGCGVLLTFLTFGTLEIPDILARASSVSGQTVNALAWLGLDWPVPVLTAIALLLFTGAIGKSAQLPLHVWLPFAMEAPTPVSALIHAATMVNAGPFLLVRFSPLLLLAPAAMIVIAVVGAVTALFAALVSMTQSDIKKILAYSTISQIGFMIMACGVGAFAAAIFHLLAHGFLKAFLFLSTGNALQAVTAHGGHGPAAHDSAAIPSVTASVGVLLFACLPPALLFAGPYEVLWASSGTGAARVAFWVLALATVFLTAMYLTRAAATHFRQTFVVAGTIVRPQFLSVPHVLVVGAGALVLTGIFFELTTGFAAFIAPAVGRVNPGVAAATGGSSVPWWPLLPLAAAVAGWAYAVMRHRTAPSPAVHRSAVSDRLYVLFWNKWYVDEIYDACVVGPNLRLAGGLARRVERAVVDGALNAVVTATVHVALWLWRVLEGRGLDRAVSSTSTASVATARWLWRVLEGRAIHGSEDRLSHQADAVGKFLERRQVHTLQEHLLLVVSGLAGLLGLFYVVFQWR
jgi:NADH-quinone oxidoreductase subunit L